VEQKLGNGVALIDVAAFRIWGGEMKKLAVAFVALGALLGPSFAADVIPPYYSPPHRSCRSTPEQGFISAPTPVG